MSRGSGRIGSALLAVAQVGFRRPKVSLALVLATVLLALASARTLRVDSDLVSLLPESFESVQGLAEYEGRGGTVGYVVLVLRGAAPEAMLEYADALAPRLEALQTVSYVEHRRAAAFFESRLLYYLDLGDLERLAERIEERADYERRRANPLLVDLLDEAAPKVELSLDEGKLPPRFARLKNSAHYLDEARGTLLVLVKPAALASDLAFARRVMDDVNGVLAAAPASVPGLTVEMGGRFAKRVAQQSTLKADLRTTSIAAVLGILGYLILYFRRGRAVVLVLAPLAVGLAWTFGLTAALFGELNVLTTFVGAILLGLGIDHGLHLVERFLTSRDQGDDPEQALAAAFAGTGRAALLAAVTTALGFAGLAVSEFKAFREFGLVSAIGGLLVLAAYTISLPALLRLLPLPARTSAANAGRFEAWIRGLDRSRAAVLLGSTGLVLAAVAQVGLLRFDYDFASLDGGQQRAFALDADIDRILGRQQAALAILTQSDADASAAAVSLRSRRTPERQTIDFTLTTRDLVPPAQADKQEILERIADEIEGFDPATLPPREREVLARLKDMVAALPFTAEALPTSVRRELVMDDPAGGGLVLVFPKVKMSDGEAILELAADLTNIPLPSGETVSGIGEAMVLADVLRLVFRETPRALAVTVSLVFLCLLVFLRRLRAATLAYAPAIVSVAATLGIAGAIGLEMNYLNVVFVPVLFGMAVDAGVHLVTRQAESRQDKLQAIAETGRAILGASLTTAAGFGALCFASHPGLRSLGALALLGVGVSLLVSLVWLPTLLLYFEPRRPDPDVRESQQTPSEPLPAQSG